MGYFLILDNILKQVDKKIIGFRKTVAKIFNFYILMRCRMKRKKILKITLNSLKVLFVAFAVYMMIFTIITVKNLNNDTEKGFLGYKMFTVLSDSMKPEFQAGDIVIVKMIKPEDLKEGDVITFYSKSGPVVTHKIEGKTVMEDEKDAFITKGINVDQADADPVPHDRVIGKYSFAIPKAGHLFNFLRTTTGYFLLIFTPLMMIILLNGYKLVKAYWDFKKEKRQEIEAQKLQLEEERLKNLKIEEELAKLKEQFNMGNNG
jgi:signal peptidase I